MTDFEWVAVALVAIASSARITRLLVWDSFAPAAWLRMKWDDATTDKTGKPNGWNLLFHCGYCMSFWVTIAVVLSGYFTDWHPIWWLVNACFAGSYLAAILMANDGDS